MTHPTNITVIVGFDQEGYRLLNAIRQYCEVTQHLVTDERLNDIFFLVVGQIFSILDVQPQKFMADLLTVPDFHSIHYLDTPIDYPTTRPFAEACRAFGLFLYDRMMKRAGIPPGIFFFLESLTPQYGVVKIHDGTQAAERVQ